MILEEAYVGGEDGFGREGVGLSETAEMRVGEVADGEAGNVGAEL